ncbi:MAG TPA: NAD(P)/FAD-dependent oxidoreductase [Planktothrix sp.]|jgi:thioredoxin reductase (NADPH)
MSPDTAITSAHADHSSSSIKNFGNGFLEACEEPIQGLSQLANGKDSGDQAKQASKSEGFAYNAGSMIGNAAVFYAAATVFKALPGGWGKAAPILAGAGIGFLGPSQGNDLGGRFKNALRGAATMTIIDHMPTLLCEKGLTNDIAGQLLNATMTGATAGAIDANMQSIFTNGKFAGWQTTIGAASSWGAMGGLFHIGSLGLGSSFQRLGEKSQDLLVFGSRNGEQTYQLRTLLNSLSTEGTSYRMVDMGKIGDASKPTVVFPDGSRVDGSDLTALSKKLNLHTTPDYDHYRVVVIGTGPAGVQTAINAASELPAGQHVALVGDVLGGQARYTSSVKNYMGFPDVTGADLMKRGLDGAKARGAETIINRVTSIESLRDGRKLLTLRDGQRFTADTVAVSTGQRYNQLTAPGVARLENKGVYTLADASESAELKGKNVFIVGGGNSAGQAAINFSRRASEVHMLIRGDNLEKSMSEYLIKEITARRNIVVHTNSEVSAVDGDQCLQQVAVATKVGDGRETVNMKADAMYVYIGGKPNTGFLDGSGVNLNEKGFVVTGHDLVDNGDWHAPERLPLNFETSVPGIFAAGDVNGANPQKRIVSAVGDAGKLIGSLHTYLATTPLSQSVRIGRMQETPQVTWLETLKLPLTSLAGGMLQAAHSHHAY